MNSKVNCTIDVKTLARGPHAPNLSKEWCGSFYSLNVIVYDMSLHLFMPATGGNFPDIW